jgi:hypothetical protein
LLIKNVEISIVSCETSQIEFRDIVMPFGM